jgi:hypothetical protein
LDQILDIAKRAASALEAAGVPHRVVGGFAVFLHIDAIDPMAARTARSSKGVLIAPVADLVHMKLTSFRLKDQVHIQDRLDYGGDRKHTFRTS